MIINDIRIWVYNLSNSFVTKKVEETITISVEECCGKKTAVKFAWRFFFLRNLINGGFPNKKGRGQTKIQKINKRGNAYLALESICGLNLDMVFFAFTFEICPLTFSLFSKIKFIWSIVQIWLDFNNAGMVFK